MQQQGSKEQAMSEQAPIMTESKNTDVIIIGAGPVGLYAIFQCGMLAQYGSQASSAAEIPSERALPRKG